MPTGATIARPRRRGTDPDAPPSLEDVWRARFVLVATVVASLLGFSVLVGATLVGRWNVVAVVAASLVVAAANLLVLRRMGNVPSVGATVVGVAYAVTLCGVVDDGLLRHGGFGWLAMVPLLAFLVLDARAARWVTIAVIGTTMLRWAGEADGGSGEQAVWVLLDRLAMVVAAGVVGGAYARVLALAIDEVEAVDRSLTTEIDTRRRAEEAAVAAGHAKTRFLGNMSHEIRTPMVGIMGMTDLLLGTELTPVQQSYARTLRQSGENLLAIINDILDFVKIDQRKLELERVPLKLRAVVEDALELLDPLADQRGVSLVTRFSPDTAEPILGDPVRIRQILLNLIGNAIKFTHEGHILVKVEIVVRSAPRRGVKFTVQDTGVGISPAKIDRLFEPFTQADVSVSRAYGGTGLGLAICKQLTDLMDGDIGVESALGRGSSFWFTVPGELAPPLHDSQHVASPLRDKVVVVASEQAYTRETARDLARYLGARHVDSVWSTADISRALRDKMMPPDFVLVDARMHQLNPQAWADAGKSVVVLLVPAGHAVPPALVDTDLLIAPIPVREKTFLMALGFADPASEPTPRCAAGLVGRVLVAEDVEVNRTVIRALAERLGCQVDLARDGLEAVEQVRESKYDLVLMDCNMPEMDGYAATRKIRQLGYDRTRLPIVALTANIMPGERERCEAAGMNDYLPKPVGQDQLERCFRRWLGPAAKASAEERPGGESGVATPAAPEAPIFDRSATLRRLGGNEDLLFSIVRSFQAEAREILEEIRETLGRRDAELLRSGAHKLKGALASIGGEAARGVAASLEAVAGAGDLDPAPEVVDRLVAEMERLEAELDRYVASRSG